MTTHLGRVVYERTKHGFEEKDVLRILKGFFEGLTAEEAIGFIVGVFVEILLKEATDRLSFLMTFLLELNKKAHFGMNDLLRAINQNLLF